MEKSISVKQALLPRIKASNASKKTRCCRVFPKTIIHMRRRHMQSMAGPRDILGNYVQPHRDCPLAPITGNLRDGLE
jgi:hypothetical protein